MGYVRKMGFTPDRTDRPFDKVGICRYLARSVVLPIIDRRRAVIDWPGPIGLVTDRLTIHHFAGLSCFI